METNKDLSYTVVNRGDPIMNEPLTTGIDDFKKVIDRKMYYVDKSLLIKDLIKYKGDANLITRPRRFGKSLNMSMLKYFFDINEKDNAYLFEGLKINEWEDMNKYQNKYPVIFLSLKEFDENNYDDAFESMQLHISELYKKHKYLLDSLEELEKEDFNKIRHKKCSTVELKNSLKFLSELLERYYHQKTIILIDEYDVPLNKSYTNGYYDRMVKLIRGMFSSSMKSNTSLEFCLLTGCLRITKESLFTGMNNFEVFDVTNDYLSEYFGFTHKEVVAMLNNDLLGSKLEDVEKWYNGYQFGNTRIYNPWSIISAVKQFRRDKTTKLCPYWGNTSSVDLIEELIEKSGIKIRRELQRLLKGESIEVELNTLMTYEDVYTMHSNDSDYFWSFMLISGYLTIDEYTQERTTVRIPNNEIRSIYISKIRKIINNSMGKLKDLKLIEAIYEEDIEYIEKTIYNILKTNISFHDVAYENSYHMFMNGLFMNNEDFEVKSNIEAGDGRLDLYLKGIDLSLVPIIIEIKRCVTGGQLNKFADEALEQIKKHEYYMIVNKEIHKEVMLVGMSFYKSNCRIRIERMVLD